MGCQCCKNEEPIPSLESMKEEQAIRGERIYQQSLRHMEDYIKTSQRFRRDIIRNSGRCVSIIISDLGPKLDQDKFNSRNISQIRTASGFYPIFYPKRDTDLSDPHFL